MTPTTWFLLLMALVVWLDARSRNCRSPVLWALGTFLLSIVIAPLYLAKRPLKQGEVREGGLVWNTCRSFALIWTLLVTETLLCGGIDYTKLGAGDYGGLSKGVFFLGMGGIWFGVVVVALVVGMVGKNNAIIERGSPISRHTTLNADLRKLGFVFGCIFAIGALILGGSCIVQYAISGIDKIKQDSANRDGIYLYPVSGADETVVNVPATQADPELALFGMRHPLPGTKVEVIGAGPNGDAKAKQIRILEGEFAGLEGWTFTECLRKEKVAWTPAHTLTRTGAVHWCFKTNGQVVCSPAVHNRTVFFGSGDRNLYALDVMTGLERWHFQAGSGVNGGVIVASGTVFCGSENGIFYALRESDGTLIWKYEPQQVSDTSAVFTTPLVNNGKVYFGNLNGVFLALDTTTGKEIWKYKAQAEINSSPVIQNQLVFFGSRDGYLYALNAATGAEQWKLNTNGTINDAPIIDRGAIIFAAAEYDPSGGSIYAVDPSTGSQKWRTKIVKERTGSFSPIAIDNRVFLTSAGLYEQHDKNYLYCLSRESGKVLWKREVPKVTTALSQFKNNVVFGSTEGLYVASVIDGSLQLFEPCGETQQSKPNVTDSAVYIGSTDKSFYALRLPARLITASIASSYPMVSNSASVGDGNVLTGSGVGASSGSSSLGDDGSNGAVRGITGGLTNNQKSSSDSDLIALNEQMREATSELKSLRQSNQKTLNEIHNLRQQLDDSQQAIDERDKNIRRLENKLISDESRQPNQPSASESINSASRNDAIKSRNNRNLQDMPIQATAPAEQQESLDLRWPNVKEFRPARCRQDILRRLYRSARARQIVEAGGYEQISIRFTIERDGHPTNIEVITPSQDEDVRKNCIAYIEAAGPFVPLLPDNLSQLSVCTELTASGSQVQIENLQIGALGNTF